MTIAKMVTTITTMNRTSPLSISSNQNCYSIRMLISKSHFTRRQGVDAKNIPTNEQLKAFIQARDKPLLRGRTLAFSRSLSGLNKDALVDIAVEFLQMPVHRRMLRNPAADRVDANQ